MKPESKAVTVYVCGNCDSTKPTREEADACCLCACGRPSVLPYASKRLCRRCQLKEIIRRNQDDLRRYETLAGAARENVARLQAEKAQIDADEKGART
jgi:hypothetical protein